MRTEHEAGLADQLVSSLQALRERSLRRVRARLVVFRGLGHASSFFGDRTLIQINRSLPELLTSVMAPPPDRPRAVAAGDAQAPEPLFRDASHRRSAAAGGPPPPRRNRRSGGHRALGSGSPPPRPAGPPDARFGRPFLFAAMTGRSVFRPIPALGPEADHPCGASLDRLHPTRAKPRPWGMRSPHEATC